MKQNGAQKHCSTLVLLGCIRLDIVSRVREVNLLLCSTLVWHIWVLRTELGSPVEEIWTYWRSER